MQFRMMLAEPPQYQRPGIPLRVFRAALTLSVGSPGAEFILPICDVVLLGGESSSSTTLRPVHEETVQVGKGIR